VKGLELAGTDFIDKCLAFCPRVYDTDPSTNSNTIVLSIFIPAGDRRCRGFYGARRLGFILVVRLRVVGVAYPFFLVGGKFCQYGLQCKRAVLASFDL
jgi:hypothetical protein